MSDKEVLAPDAGIVLNELKCRRGFMEAKRTDINQERARRRELANKDSEFQHHLIACQTELGFTKRELANAYWAIRTELPCEQSFPKLAEVTGIPLDRLVECYERLTYKPRATVKPRGAPKSGKRERKHRPKTASVGGKLGKSKSPPAPKEAVWKIREYVLIYNKTPNEIYKGQEPFKQDGVRMARNPLPGMEGKAIANGNIAYFCTNHRQKEVGWPGLGVVAEEFLGKGGPERARKELRARLHSLPKPLHEVENIP